MEEYKALPRWKKALLWVFVVLMPFIGSCDGIAF